MPSTLLPTPEPTEDDTIIHSRLWIHENKTRGVECPTCGKHVEEYRRTISQGQAFALNAMYSNYNHRWVSLRRMRNKLKVDSNGELTKLAHWRLIRQHPTRGGTWALTDLGADWIAGRLDVPSSTYVYQGELTGQCIHRVSFQDSMNGQTCHHGHIPTDDSGDPYREQAPSSDLMFNAETLSDRRNKIVIYPDSPDDLLVELGDGLERVINPLRHDHFSGHESIKTAQEWIERKLKHKGGICPSCDRLAAFNQTKITDAHAHLLIEMYKRYRMKPVHVPSFTVGEEAVGREGHASESAHRGLLSVETTKSGGTRSGWYRLTDEGVDWIYNRSKTPESIRSYNRFALKIVGEKKVSITEVFDRSTKYWYDDLMHGV